MKTTDLFWLVGLLEGEGSFMRGPPSEPRRLRIALHMTDEDIIARAALLLRARYVRRRDRRNKSWKPTYFVSVRGRKAASLMRLLRPHMGLRRKAQINRATRGFIDRPPGHPRVLDPGKVRRIRTSPLSAGRLAIRYGVSVRTIDKVRSRATWKHVN